MCRVGKSCKAAMSDPVAGVKCKLPMSLPPYLFLHPRKAIEGGKKKTHLGTPGKKDVPDWEGAGQSSQSQTGRRQCFPKRGSSKVQDSQWKLTGGFTTGKLPDTVCLHHPVPCWGWSIQKTEMAPEKDGKPKQGSTHFSQKAILCTLPWNEWNNCNLLIS
jgi:hypothetical protein